MFLKTVLLLASMASIYCQDSPHPKDIPVSLKELDNVVIDDYHGDMDSRTTALFSNVKTLSVQNCNFTTFNENFLQPLTNLEKLIMAYNNFEKIERDASVCCPKLREMEIHQTHDIINDTDMKKMAAMPALERLRFHKMNVPSLFSKSLFGSNLKTLEIEFSNLETIEDGAFDGMDKLEVLILRNNKLTKFPTKSLASLKNLKELNLAGNLLDKLFTDDFPLFPNLEKVNIGHNPMKKMNLKGLEEKLPKYNEIDISGLDLDVCNKTVPYIKMPMD